MIGAVVGPLVSPVVDQVDVDSVLDRIDVDHVLARVDIDGVIERIDLDAVVARLDINQIIDRVDINQIIDRVDLDAVVARVDIDAVVARVDIDAVVARLDLDAVVARLDLDAVVARLDLDAVIARVDVNEVLARVDTVALVERTEIGALIAKSTSSVFTTVLDALRRQVVTADLVTYGVIDRVFHRSSVSDTDGATAPVPPDGTIASDGASPSGSRLRRALLPGHDVDLQGQPAGAVSRVLAFGFDWLLLSVLFVVGQRLLSLGVEVVLGETWEPSDHQALAGLAFVVWLFLYFAVPIGLLGRTPGKGLLGLKVLCLDGTDVSGRRAAWRTLVLPLSFLLFCFGLFLGLFRRDRRTLHDLIARTKEVYEWDARAAQLRFLAQRHE